MREFDQAFLTGNEKIDDQHREIFELAEAIEICMLTDDIESAIKCYLKLIDHIIYHFDYEEEMMRSINYPVDCYYKHTKEHRDLRYIYFTEYAAVRMQEKTIQEILTIVETSVVKHIAEFDRVLAQFIQNNTEC